MMLKKNSVKTKSHTASSTTFKVDAGTPKYHCLFFCRRQTDIDVIDPRDTAPSGPARARTISIVDG